MGKGWPWLYTHLVHIYIKKSLKEEGLDWIHLTQGKANWWIFMHTVLNILVP
jgi:hypothetical protein